MENNRNLRIDRMSEAFDKLCKISDVLVEKAEELEASASEVDLLKEYVVSGQWLEDYEADENGMIPPEVNRSVLSQDGLYDLLGDLDGLMHTFERLLEHFVEDPEPLSDI